MRDKVSWSSLWYREICEANHKPGVLLELWFLSWQWHWLSAPVDVSFNISLNTTLFVYMLRRSYCLMIKWRSLGTGAWISFPSSTMIRSFLMWSSQDKCRLIPTTFKVMVPSLIKFSFWFFAMFWRTIQFVQTERQLLFSTIQCCIFDDWFHELCADHLLLHFRVLQNS